MSYRDTWATCEKCGKQFIFTVEEQRRLTELGFEAKPSKCPDCQSAIDLEPGQRQGVVKWYDAEKKYGFITQRSGDDIFFHRDGIMPGEKPQFPDGTPVIYRVEQSQKGPKAVDVARIDVPKR